MNPAFVVGFCYVLSVVLTVAVVTHPSHWIVRSLGWPVRVMARWLDRLIDKIEATEPGEDWEPPRCKHGRIILGCPRDDCEEQNGYLAAQAAAMSAHENGYADAVNAALGRPSNGRGNVAG